MINEYSNPVSNTLESYIPLPLQEIFKAGQAVQQRGDDAQQADNTALTGLSSMEALAPAQRDYINKSVDNFKQQQSDLIDKYSNNYSDPNFINEARRINMQFANDPKLQMIKQTNDNLKRKQAIGTELQSKGIKMLDSNPNFTGTDGNGNLTTDPGHFTATNFDGNIDQGFRDKSNIMTVSPTGNKVSNADALHNEKLSRMNGLVNGTDKDMMDAVNYYKQNGATDNQAKLQALSLLDKGMGFLHETPNYQGAELAMRQQDSNERVREFNIQEQDKKDILAEKAREANLKAQGKGVNGMGEITSTPSPLIPNTPNKTKVDQLMDVFNRTQDNGKLGVTNYTLPNTPENVDKLKKDGTNFSIPHNGPEIVVSPGNNYSPTDVRALDEAKDLLGDKATGTPRNIINKYITVLKNSQAESLSYAIPENDKYAKALTQNQFGQYGEKLGHTYTLITPDGTFKSGTKDAENIISGIKHISATGINASPVGDYPNGSIRGSATTKDGKAVTIIKPMDDNTQSQYRFANIGARAKESSFTNDELKTSIAAKEFRIPAKGGGYLVPQKGVTSDNRIGVHFVHIDEKGHILNDISPISLGDVVSQAHSSYYSRLGQSIDDKAEKQGYTENSDDE